MGQAGKAHLEALVLQHPLDGSVLAAGRQLRLEDDAEGAIADDLALRIGKVFVLARLAVLHFLANDLCGFVSFLVAIYGRRAGGARRGGFHSPPILRDEKAVGRLLMVRGTRETGSAVERAAS